MPNILRLWLMGVLLHFVPTTGYGQTTVLIPPTIATATAKTITNPIGWYTSPVWLRTDTLSSISAWVVPSRLGVRELQTTYGMVHLRNQDWSLAAGISALTMEIYTELAKTVAFALPLSNQLSIGVVGTYTYARARGFSTEHLVMFNAQMIFAIDSLTHVGINAQNLTQTKRVGSSMGAIQQLNIGASHQIAQNLSLDVDIVLYLRVPAGMTAAFRWDPIDILALRVAWASIQQCAEVSFRLAGFGPLMLLGCIHYHLTLGMSPTIGLSYQW